jgi:transcriptional regulator with GAF, ATPase, and Fis domain
MPSNVFDTLRDVLPNSAIVSSRMSSAYLTQVYPHDANTSVRLSEQGSLTIGRSPGAEGLTIEDLRVSRRHASVTWDPSSGGHRLTDLGSANGTSVNGKHRDSALIEHGDVLRFGTALFVYQRHDPMQACLQTARAVAPSGASVLVLGETGVGKEVLSRKIHDLSGRKGPFVAVNCAALPKDLAAAELFGHVRGAFSGAHVARPGLIASADRGTLLLDEIGELPLELQALLLRALELRAVRPVGGDAERVVDVRLVAATNAPVDAWAEQGRFRADLLARLQQVTIAIPRLRERRTEILGLAREFAAQHGRELALSFGAAENLLLYEFPQNVRELKNLIARFCAMSRPSEVLGTSYLRRQLRRDVRSSEYPARVLSDPGCVRASRSSVSPPRKRSLSDRGEVESRLRELGGNVAQLARELKTSRAHVYRWLNRLGIDVNVFRS